MGKLTVDGKPSLNGVIARIAGAVARLLPGKGGGGAPSAPPPAETLSREHGKILLRRVPHYRSLDAAGRELFRRRAASFLDGVAFHGAGVRATSTLRLLAASAAVVPTLGFPGWEWTRLREIIFRPEGNERGEHRGDGGVVTEFAESGMVGGSGVMAGTMMLSSEDLLWEFAHPEEGANVGFHEFAHLMADGGLVLAEPDRGAWAGLVRAESARIRRGDSLLGDYALLDEDEFFAVATELFFTVPSRFRSRHRKLYAVLSRCYRQNPAAWLEARGFRRKIKRP